MKDFAFHKKIDYADWIPFFWRFVNFYSWADGVYQDTLITNIDNNGNRLLMLTNVHVNSRYYNEADYRIDTAITIRFRHLLTGAIRPLNNPKILTVGAPGIEDSGTVLLLEGETQFDDGLLISTEQWGIANQIQIQTLMQSNNNALGTANFGCGFDYQFFGYYSK